VSECGVRNSNEDAYLIVSDFVAYFDEEVSEEGGGADWGLSLGDVIYEEWGVTTPLAIFAIFDGHCGSQTARFASEKLASFLRDSILSQHSDDNDVISSSSRPKSVVLMEQSLLNAIARLDEEFCNLCKEDGRDWESGATALITLLFDDSILVANLGDCRGVLCCSRRNKRNNNASTEDKSSNDDDDDDDGWCLLEDDDVNDTTSSSSHRSSMPSDAVTSAIKAHYKELVDTHSPSRQDERSRIEAANGWVTTEREVCIGQLQRMDFCDEDVVEILQRCFSDRFDDVKKAGNDLPVAKKGGAGGGGSNGKNDTTEKKKKSTATPGRLLIISRVCGELAVSRALGDRDFKASFNELSIELNKGQLNMTMPNIGDYDDDKDSPSDDSKKEDELLGCWWMGPNFLPYPPEHNFCFKGDLISAVPEVKVMTVGSDGVFDEFLILACDGLWDVMDVDDAVRVARDLLFEKRWSAKKAAARLAELAIHLGSSDNTTVILIRLFRGRASS